jgi:hypothetical protein
VVWEVRKAVTTLHPLPLSSPPRKVRWGLILVESVIALNAVGGAVYGLAGAKDVPREWLEGTPFDSYVVPSLILLTGVGGGMAVAALSLLLRWHLAPEISIAAGAVLFGWIVTQVVIIVPDGGFSWLQPTMFAVGVLIAALGWRLRRERDVEGRSHGDSR